VNVGGIPVERVRMLRDLAPVVVIQRSFSRLFFAGLSPDQVYKER
jgi:hypothetical protein